MSFLAKIKNALGVKGSQVEVDTPKAPQPEVKVAVVSQPPESRETLKVVATPKVAIRAAAQPRPPVEAQTSRSALALEGSPQVQADWLQVHIGKIAKSFAHTASRQSWSSPAAEGVFARVDVAALMLGYKMVSLGYQLHNDPPGVEVMRLLRGAITVPLHRAMQALPTIEGVDRVQEVEDYLKGVNLEVSEALKNLRSKKEGAFAPFHKDLAVAFGGASSAEQATRFASPLNEGFTRLEQAMAAQAAERSRQY